MTAELAVTSEALDRRKTNPLFNSNKLKLGLFGINCDRACAMTLSKDAPLLTWEYTKEVAQIADRAGFEALVPVSRWKEIGDNGFNGRNFDTYAWAAGLAEATDQICLVTTSHVVVHHPAVSAKIVATLDHMTGGRACLNLVNGWFEPEFKMFGADWLPHDERYNFTTEWTEALLKFWTEDEFDFKGKYFNIEGGYSYPKPLQQPLPPIMSAGGSDAGRKFAATYADMGYVLLTNYNLEASRIEIDQRREEYAQLGKDDMKLWTTAYVVQRDTKEEAEEYVQKVFVEEGDIHASEMAAQYLGLNWKGWTPEVWEQFSLHLRAGYGGYPIVGTADDVAETLAGLSDIGIDGVSLSFVDFRDGLHRFNADVLPKLEAAGLRAPYTHKGKQ